jgi:acetolactate synthase-1/2/3 large subunit
MNGAELIAKFIEKKCFPKVFLVTGGACAFIVDAIGRNEEIDYVCMQHEQAAAMAADAVWRTCGLVGVTVATSGPGATNLITGIACSWFDSIPTLHITGQVNQRESAESLGVNVRQAGFQETDIVDICSSITKYAVKVRSTKELAKALAYGIQIAISGRMGPVLIDVPMDVQQAECSDHDIATAFADVEDIKEENYSIDAGQVIHTALSSAERPLVILGAGLGLSGQTHRIQRWCEKYGIPYCSSWGGLPFLEADGTLYQGSIGVYGSRRANWAIQSADVIIALGSRLDNRQRTGNPFAFAPFAKVFVFDVDKEELKKFETNKNYSTINFDLRNAEKLETDLEILSSKFEPWRLRLASTLDVFDDGFNASVGEGELNPYTTVQKLQSFISEDAIIVSDCGANLCWVYQAIVPSKMVFFTAGGNSPMGYAVPAAIGAAIANPTREVVCFIGDGGLQMNIQELQTIVNYKLKVKIVILNNLGYGIIKQFQDAYFDSRYEATGRGYSLPDFGKISGAYGIEYERVTKFENLTRSIMENGPVVIDVILPPNALITPKVEMDRFIHDQFPYGSLHERPETAFMYPDRPSGLAKNGQ